MFLTSKPFSQPCSESLLYCPDFRLHLSEGVLCSPVSSRIISFLKPAAEELDAHLECPAQCPMPESQARRASAVTGSQGSIVGFSLLLLKIVILPISKAGLSPGFPRTPRDLMPRTAIYSPHCPDLPSQHGLSSVE